MKITISPTGVFGLACYITWAYSMKWFDIAIMVGPFVAVIEIGRESK